MGQNGLIVNQLSRVFIYPHSLVNLECCFVDFAILEGFFSYSL